MDRVIKITSILLRSRTDEEKKKYLEVYGKYLISNVNAQELFILSLDYSLIEAAIYLYQNEDVLLPINYLIGDGWKYFEYMKRYSLWEWKKKAYIYNKKYKDIDIIWKFAIIGQ